MEMLMRCAGCRHLNVNLCFANDATRPQIGTTVEDEAARRYEKEPGSI